MTLIQDILANKLLVCAVAGWCIAQILKTLLHMFVTKKFVVERLVGSGGMPSSHSATVSALATAACIEYGLQSAAFAISLILAVIVMYDARGVRRETGKQAKVLNEMLEIFRNTHSDMSPQDRLKEFIGHTPLQVLAGAILGILIATLLCTVL